MINHIYHTPPPKGNWDWELELGTDAKGQTRNTGLLCGSKKVLR